MYYFRRYHHVLLKLSLRFRLFPNAGGLLPITSPIARNNPNSNPSTSPISQKQGGLFCETSQLLYQNSRDMICWESLRLSIIDVKRLPFLAFPLLIHPLYSRRTVQSTLFLKFRDALTPCHAACTASTPRPYLQRRKATRFSYGVLSTRSIAFSARSDYSVISASDHTALRFPLLNHHAFHHFQSSTFLSLSRSPVLRYM